MSIQTQIKKPGVTSAPTDQGRGTQTETIGNQSMESIMSGRAESMGRRLDLPDAIRSKMETSFGADFSTVQLYESQAVADAGAKAVTSGGKIGFAPGKMDLSSVSGQALLGHELSHVVSQARGQVSGSGFLGDSGLESRADHEGIMAATGESVYTGSVAPLSASCISTTTGPLQAKLTEEEKTKALDERAALPDLGDGFRSNLLRDVDLDNEVYHSCLTQGSAKEKARAQKKREQEDVMDQLNNDYRGYDALSGWEKFKFNQKNKWAVQNAANHKFDTVKRNYYKKEMIKGSGIENKNDFIQKTWSDPSTIGLNKEWDEQFANNMPRDLPNHWIKRVYGR